MHLSSRTVVAAVVLTVVLFNPAVARTATVSRQSATTRAVTLKPAPDSATNQPQRGTAENPLMVQVLPSEDERREDRKEQEEKRKSDQDLVRFTAQLAEYTNWLFKATFGLAIATILLVGATIGLVIYAAKQAKDMRKSIKIANKSARSAKESVTLARREFAAAMRPRLTLRSLYMPQFGDKVCDLNMEFYVLNTGVSPPPP